MLFEGARRGRAAGTERSRIRLVRIGFVFQRFFLLPMLTAARERRAAAGRGRRGARRIAVPATRELLATSAWPIARITCRRSSPAARCSASPIARALANRPRAARRRRTDRRAGRGHRPAHRRPVRPRPRRRHRDPRRDAQSAARRARPAPPDDEERQLSGVTIRGSAAPLRCRVAESIGEDRP